MPSTPTQVLKNYLKSAGRKTVDYVKDPSNVLFLAGALIIAFFVAMSLVGSEDQAFLVDAANADKSGLPKREYSGTIWSKFYITIPKADVFKAEVTTNVDSKVDKAYMPILEKSIAHYQGSAYPGQIGNSFVYGHSILPQFFNPKIYKTIFSHLYKVQVGDKVSVQWGSDTYSYLVTDRRQVDPKDLAAVTFNRDSKVLSIMTCDPPGTYFKRLIIEAEQVGQSSLPVSML